VKRTLVATVVAIVLSSLFVGVALADGISTQDADMTVTFTPQHPAQGEIVTIEAVFTPNRTLADAELQVEIPPTLSMMGEPTGTGGEIDFDENDVSVEAEEISEPMSLTFQAQVNTYKMFKVLSEISYGDRDNDIESYVQPGSWSAEIQGAFQYPALPEGTEVPSGTVSINTADVEELDLLPGVGPSTAASISEYRLTQGYFEVISDVLNVPGIGPSTLGKMSDMIFIVQPDQQIAVLVNSGGYAPAWFPTKQELVKVTQDGNPVADGELSQTALTVQMKVAGYVSGESDGSDLPEPLVDWLEGSTNPYDLNGDGEVNGDDLTIFLVHYGSSVGDDNYNADCDFDDSGRIDVSDAMMLISNF